MLELLWRLCLHMCLTYLKLAGKNVRMSLPQPRAVTARTKHLHLITEIFLSRGCLSLLSFSDVDWLDCSTEHTSSGKGSRVPFLFRLWRCCVNRREFDSVNVISRSFKRSMLSRRSLKRFSFGESLLNRTAERIKISNHSEFFFNRM